MLKDFKSQNRLTIESPCYCLTEKHQLQYFCLCFDRSRTIPFMISLLYSLVRDKLSNYKSVKGSIEIFEKMMTNRWTFFFIKRNNRIDIYKLKYSFCLETSESYNTFCRSDFCLTLSVVSQCVNC